MPTYLYYLIGLIGLLFTVFAAWRLVSQRESLPCPTWLGWMVELDNPVFRNNSARAIIQHLDLQPGMKVLDFGCGPGRLTIPVARQLGPKGEVIAYDVQPGMLRRTQEKAQAANLSNIRYLQAGSGTNPLGRNHYDCALLVTVLGEIPDRSAALTEIFAALKPGGLLSITEVIADPHFQRLSTVRQLAASAGFKESACFGHRLSYTLHLKKPERRDIRAS
jgi:2-polyprenyl-3-methyl-5-hydroxy-6-metoxy-1,4-benzoquinol methylase